MRSPAILFCFTLLLLISTGHASQNLDVDGDNNSDILWRNQTTGQNWLWTMNGVVVSQSKSLNTISLDWEIVGRGDFDGDGKSDILWRNSETGRNYIYLMDGFTILQAKELNYIADVDWKIKAVTDLNGDGKDDIVWHHQTTGRTWIYLINGISITKSIGSQTVSDLGWEIVASGDLNGDNNGDIIWRHESTGQNYIWLMNGSSITSQYILNSISPSWQIAGTGDLNGDSTDDIIWRNADSGMNWAYLMEDGQISTSKQINTIADKDWHIRTIGDLNGDGKADIFWRHQDSGKTYAYLMDGINIITAGYSSVISLNWQIFSDSTISLLSDIVSDDCADNESTSCSLAIDSSVSGAIETEADIDAYKVEVAENGSLTISSTGLADFDGAFYEQGNSVPLIEDEDSGTGNNFSLTYNVSAGTYFIKVSGAIESYTLTSQFTADNNVVPSDYYKANVSEQITQSKCIVCHTSSGAAKSSRLHFLSSNSSNYLENNQQEYIDLLSETEGDTNLILMKSIGSSGHGGGPQLAEGSDDYNALLTYLELIK